MVVMVDGDYTFSARYGAIFANLLGRFIDILSTTLYVDDNDDKGGE